MKKNASFIRPAAHPPRLRRPAPRLLRRRRPNLHPGLSPLQLPPLRLHSPRRPWSELTDRSAFSRPDSVTEAASRVRKNLSYFRVNYLALLATVLAVSLLSHPFSLLILLSLLAAWCFLYLFRPAEPPLVFFGRTFSDRETLGALVFLTVLVIFLTSVGSLLISALMVGAVIVAVHGAFRVPEDLFLDDQDPGGAYIFGMALLILLVFAFVVTRPDGSYPVPGRAYSEYRLAGFSSWLRDHITDSNHWDQIRACLGTSDVCQKLGREQPYLTADQYLRNVGVGDVVGGGEDAEGPGLGEGEEAVEWAASPQEIWRGRREQDLGQKK